MSPREPPAPSIVDVDAEVVLRHPLVIVWALLAATPAAAALLPVVPLGIAACASALVAVIALLARRVSGADLSGPPTV